MCCIMRLQTEKFDEASRTNGAQKDMEAGIGCCFAVHHWAHTWLGRVSDYEQKFDVREMVAAEQEKVACVFLNMCGSWTDCLCSILD
jgi:hypothetical protein